MAGRDAHGVRQTAEDVREIATAGLANLSNNPAMRSALLRVLPPSPPASIPPQTAAGGPWPATSGWSAHRLRVHRPAGFRRRRRS